jgi:hypothetical protein
MGRDNATIHGFIYVTSINKKNKGDPLDSRHLDYVMCNLAKLLLLFRRNQLPPHLHTTLHGIIMKKTTTMCE